MKKIFFSALLAFLFVDTAHAKTGPFLGLDINQSQATHRYLHENGNKTDKDNNYGYSVSAGYNVDFNKFFLAPELFYDKLNNTNNSYLCPQGGNHYCKDKMDINARYGIKLNLGYEVAKNIRLFANAGYSNIKMQQRYLNGYTEITSGRVLVSSNKNGVFTYGFGASYNLTDNFALRASYEISNFKVIHENYLTPNPTDKIKLRILKFGVAYTF